MGLPARYDGELLGDVLRPDEGLLVGEGVGDPGSYVGDNEGNTVGAELGALLGYGVGLPAR